MKLDKLIAVSGLPGIFRMAANRNNGLIIEDVATGKRQFAASRSHQFTPLESIAIYTDDGESVELKHVFRNMLQQMEDNPPLEANAPSQDLREYFEDILPNYDKNRVSASDIKKVIKWFNYLNDCGLLSEEAESVDSSEEEE